MLKPPLTSAVHLALEPIVRDDGTQVTVVVVGFLIMFMVAAFELPRLFESPAYVAVTVIEPA